MNMFRAQQEQEQERREESKRQLIASVVSESVSVILALRCMSKEDKSAAIARLQERVSV